MDGIYAKQQFECLPSLRGILSCPVLLLVHLITVILGPCPLQAEIIRSPGALLNWVCILQLNPEQTTFCLGASPTRMSNRGFFPSQVRGDVATACRLPRLLVCRDSIPLNSQQRPQ